MYYFILFSKAKLIRYQFNTEETYKWASNLPKISVLGDDRSVSSSINSLLGQGVRGTGMAQNIMQTKLIPHKGMTDS